MHGTANPENRQFESDPLLHSSTNMLKIYTANLLNYESFWKRYYDTVKGIDWPNDAKDMRDLPGWVQKELLELYDYQILPYRYCDLPDPRLFFDINGQDYEFVGKNNALISLDKETKLKINLQLEIFHNDSNQIEGYVNQTEALIITNAFDKRFQKKHILYNDFLFNRTKAYYTGYPFKPDTILWYNYSPNSYINLRVKTAENKTKIFIAPNKTYNKSRKYRVKIVEKL